MKPAFILYKVTAFEFMCTFYEFKRFWLLIKLVDFIKIIVIINNILKS